MRIRPIRTEEDYQAALKLAASLFGSDSQTDRDELEILQALIEKWENSRHTIDAPTAAEAIRFRMSQAGLVPRDLVPYLGSKSRVSEILSGVRQPTVDQIRALHLHLGIPVSSLIGTFKHEPSARPSNTSKAAVEKLRDLGFIKAKETLADFLSRVAPSAPAISMLRKTRTERTNAKTDMAALEAWCTAVLLKAEKVAVEKKAKIREPHKAARKLAQQSALPDWREQVEKKLEEMGIALVILEHLPGTFLDGAAMCRADGVPIIALTLRHDRLDNFWFTLLHEFAHVVCHLRGDRQVILDDLDVASSETIEAEADSFAQEALIPSEIWEKLNKDSSTKEILKAAREAGVNKAIVAGRWRYQYSDYRKFSKLVGRGEVKKAFLQS